MRHAGNDYRNVARVVGKIGKEGEVKVDTIDGLPFLLHQGMRVHFTPPRLTGIRSAVVQSVREVGDSWGVRLQGVDTVEQAFELQGRLCLVSTEDIEELADWDDPMLLVGLPVRDLRLGSLGEVTDVLVTSQQITLVVGTEQKPDRYLIPFVDEFIIEMEEDEESGESDDQGQIVVEIPDSLASLNE